MGRHLSTEVDRNFDQRIDEINMFDGHGQMVRTDSDEDFDVVMETHVSEHRSLVPINSRLVAAIKGVLARTIQLLTLQ